MKNGDGGKSPFDADSLQGICGQGSSLTTRAAAASGIAKPSRKRGLMESWPLPGQQRFVPRGVIATTESSRGKHFIPAGAAAQSFRKRGRRQPNGNGLRDSAAVSCALH